MALKSTFNTKTKREKLILLILATHKKCYFYHVEIVMSNVHYFLYGLTIDKKVIVFYPLGSHVKQQN